MAKKKENRFYSLLLLALVVLVVILIFYYLSLSKKAPATVPATPTTEEGAPAAGRIVEVPFDYLVKSVSAGQILITGERGDMTLPTDERVKIYKGAAPDEQPASLDDLAEGQKIRLKMIPGEAAWVYILE